MACKKFFLITVILTIVLAVLGEETIVSLPLLLYNIKVVRYVWYYALRVFI